MSKLHISRSLLTALTLWALVGATPARGGPIYSGPSPYLSFADSPYQGGTFDYFHLEDFEDGALNTPGVIASSGWRVIGPGILEDSVDADDGAIDGSGTAGKSFWSRGQQALSFTFVAAALGGNLPTHVGLVWTDVGAVKSGAVGFGPVSFSATDALGASLGSIGPFTLGDGNAAGATAEDRFFGVINPGGIATITIRMDNSTDWEVDHLQYGFASAAVPEPAGFALFAAGVAGLATYRRWRRRSAG